MLVTADAVGQRIWRAREEDENFLMSTSG